ncbi:hypothetical protein B0H11DRAFT_2092993 [Mycena galericulata]|nr:hypothetical protein B0H11DRAFT_2092993 [Mycena galericulata]
MHFASSTLAVACILFAVFVGAFPVSKHHGRALPPVLPESIHRRDVPEQVQARKSISSAQRRTPEATTIDLFGRDDEGNACIDGVLDCLDARANATAPSSSGTIPFVDGCGRSRTPTPGHYFGPPKTSPGTWKLRQLGPL